MSTQIIGAGLSGLIAGHIIPDAQILERNPIGQMHNAVLRFRSDIVSQTTGIPFKKVIVRKGIWLDAKFIQPNIAVCNAYSKKIFKTVEADRSIWNIDPVERWIAPQDFYERMVKKLQGEKRLWFGNKVDLEALIPGTISTAPLPVMMKALSITEPVIDFQFQPIYTMKIYLGEFSGIYQTIYYPTECHGLYRASVTDNELILEFTKDTFEEKLWIVDLLDSFSITPEMNSIIHDMLIEAECEPAGKKDRQVKTQEYGKIMPIDGATRHALLLYISAKWGIYSLGRFATWRNILLDDIVHDAERIKEMMVMDDYQTKLQRR